MISSSLAFTDTGTGPVLVFLHGFCESKDLWADFTPPLNAHFRCLALDLPGHGESPLPDSFSMESQAEQVYQTVQKLTSEKILLIGHSMGGYVALAFAQKYPDRLRGLCLFHSSALADAEEKQESRNKTVAFVQKHGVDTFMESFVAPLFASANQAENQAAIRKMQEIGKKTLLETVTGCLIAMRDRTDRTQVLKAISVPVLFMAGKEDPAVPLEATLQQCHLPQNSMTYFMGGVGHMGMFERAAATRQALQKFAESIYK